MGFPVAGSGFAPGGGHEEHEHGKKLQPADEHIKGEHQLAEGAESRKVFGGADPGEPRPDVVDRGGHRGKIGLQRETVEADSEHRKAKDHQIGREKDVDGAQHLVGHHVPVEHRLAHCPGMGQGEKLLLDGLE